MAFNATKDMSWKLALAGPDRPKVIKAYGDEVASLCDTILTRVHKGDSEYAKAVELATPGRALLDIKRSGDYKGRIVKQGFKENKTLADGPDFNYYAHTAKLMTVRTAILRHNRAGRRLAAVPERPPHGGSGKSSPPPARLFSLRRDSCKVLVKHPV